MFQALKDGRASPECIAFSFRNRYPRRWRWQHHPKERKRYTTAWKSFYRYSEEQGAVFLTVATDKDSPGTHQKHRPMRASTGRRRWSLLVKIDGDPLTTSNTRNRPRHKPRGDVSLALCQEVDFHSTLDPLTSGGAKGVHVVYVQLGFASPQRGGYRGVQGGGFP